MPIFEYACSSCQKQFDCLMRNAADEKDVTCPDCGGNKLEKLFSVPAAPRAAAALQPVSRAGGCGRCGDPNGPCAA